MEALIEEGSAELVQEIDAVARATHGWVHQQLMERRFLGINMSQGEERTLAAGFLAGLRGNLQLVEAEYTLIAYAYLLMCGKRDDLPRAVACLVAEIVQLNASAPAYLHGQEAAVRAFINQPV
jgi:hypothetical protein